MRAKAAAFVTGMRRALLVVAALALTTGMAMGFTVSGTVRDNANTPFVSALVEALDPLTTGVVASTMTNASGAYSLTVAAGTYNMRATPPAGSSFAPATLLGQTISADTTINFVLVPTQTAITV